MRPVEDWSERRYVPALTTILRVLFFMFTFILVVQAIVAAALVGVVLMQRSEGGGLGVGGSPSGLMSARGAADFLTRATTILAILFVGLSICLALLASVKHELGRASCRERVCQYV